MTRDLEAREKESGMGLPVVISPDQTAGSSPSVTVGLTEKEHSWQPVGNPFISCHCASVRKEQGHWEYCLCFVPGASYVLSPSANGLMK